MQVSKINSVNFTSRTKNNSTPQSDSSQNKGEIQRNELMSKSTSDALRAISFTSKPIRADKLERLAQKAQNKSIEILTQAKQTFEFIFKKPYAQNELGLLDQNYSIKIGEEELSKYKKDGSIIFNNSSSVHDEIGEKFHFGPNHKLTHYEKHYSDKIAKIDFDETGKPTKMEEVLKEVEK